METKLEYALAYAEKGLYILPIWWWDEENKRCACGKSDCQTPAKHPLTVNGQANGTRDPAVIKGWWARYKDANIGAYLKPSGLCAIDIDPRNGGFFTLERIEDEHGPLVSDVLQYTGGGGEHRVFQAPAESSLPGKLGPGIDVKYNGYIILEPSNHESGGTYIWESESSILNDCVPSPLPDWMRDVVPYHRVNNHEAPPNIPLSEGEIAEIESALHSIPVSECNYNDWLNFGMALHNEVGGQAGYDIWCQWSQQSPYFNPTDHIKKWRSFKRLGIEGICKATIFDRAYKCGWTYSPEPSESYELEEEAPELELPPLPGIMGQIEQYYNDSSRNYQPLFAKQTALAIGSVLLGRRFKTSESNFSAMYFLIVGPSGCGKEHCRTVVQEVLRASGMYNLIGGDGFTSEGAVASLLLKKPVSISLIDEMGHYMESSLDKKSGGVKKGAITALMQVITRIASSYYPPNYSSMTTVSKPEDDRFVDRPSLTILGSTTPDTFFSAMSSTQVKDGFLSRLVVQVSRQPRTVGRSVGDVAVPQSIIQWAGALNERCSDRENAGIYYHATIQNPPAPIAIEISREASRLLHVFAEEQVDLMNRMDMDKGPTELLVRVAEFAHRIAMILALSDDPWAKTVEASHAEYAIQYMRAASSVMVHESSARMADSKFEADTNSIYQAIRSAGPNGVTESEMRRKKPFKSFPDKSLGELLKSLKGGTMIDIVKIADGGKGKGRGRTAWVATKVRED